MGRQFFNLPVSRPKDICDFLAHGKLDMSEISYPRYQDKHFGKRKDFIDKICQQTNRSALSALDSLEASLWLMSGGRTSQALSLFHHTVEIAFKGLLEEIDVLLTIDKLNYDLAKAVA